MVFIFTARFNTKSLHFATERVYVFLMLGTSTNKYFPMQHSPSSLCNESKLCSLYGTNGIFIHQVSSEKALQGVELLRRLVDGFLPRRGSFDPRLVHMGFLAYKVVLGQFFSE